MPRIIVVSEDPHSHDGVCVTLDEDVRAVHLSTGHAASQLVERIAWAVRDAEAHCQAKRGMNVSSSHQLNALCFDEGAAERPAGSSALSVTRS